MFLFLVRRVVLGFIRVLKNKSLIDIKNTNKI